MDPNLQLILGLIQAAGQLTPVIAGALPSVEAVFNGTATDADITALEAVRDALNVQAQTAEQKVIDGAAATG